MREPRHGDLEENGLRNQVPMDQHERCFVSTPGLRRLYCFIGTCPVKLQTLTIQYILEFPAT